MTEHTRNTAILFTALLAFGVSGCATTGVDRPAGPSAELPASIADVNYEVKSGDLLSEIALRLTGSASNWQAIATQNNIKDPRDLAVGKVLVIPGYLILNRIPLTANTLPSSTQTLDTRTSSPIGSSEELNDATSGRTAFTPPVTTGNGVSVPQGRAVQYSTTSNSSNAGSGYGDIADITLSAVSINRTFDLQPVGTSFTSSEAGIKYGSEAPQIRVIGSYYPKGVYEQPASYSRLIERVTPGMLFELDSEINDWYKIITDQGVGYIRQSDSLLVR